MTWNDVSSRLPSVLVMPKVVRDLLWTMTSPHMLNGDKFPVLPPEFGVEALKLNSVIDWFNDLAADPTPLLTFLQETTSSGRSLALGVYFSKLLEFWLRFCPNLGVEKMEIGKQIVSSTNRTVGQLKFLFRCNFLTEQGHSKQRDFHVESSVKFFLLNPMDTGAVENLEQSEVLEDTKTTNGFVPLEQCVGPHLGENLAWRVQEVERKLALRQGDSVRAWIEDNFSDKVQSHIVLRGYLFQPLSHLMSTSETAVAHGWQFHQSIVKSDEGFGYDNALSNPSIAMDHMRGWWTTDFENELTAKVKANDHTILGESRFVVLPKLHWLSQLIAVEDEESGQVFAESDDQLDIPQVVALTLDELLVFVRDHFQKVASSAETSRGIAMPLLVAEIVRCPDNFEFSVQSQSQHWYELSRGFILDPKCWDPAPLCKKPVRSRRTLGGNVTNGSKKREYDIRTDWGGEGFIKLDTDETAAQNEQNRHRFPDPARVNPTDLGRELVSLLRGERELVSYTDLKRSTIELFLWRRQHLISDDPRSPQYGNESAFLRSCLESLILDINDVNESKLAQRVGYMLLDVFDNLNRESCLNESISQEFLNWVDLLTAVGRNFNRWEFINLVLRAIDLTLSVTQITQWEGSEKSAKFSFLDKLLATRSVRWNAVVVEVIRVFRIGELIPGHTRLKPSEDGQKVRKIFADFVDQRDWQNAERLAIVVEDYEMMETLFKHLSLLNMTKALKRLQKIGVGVQNTQIEAPLSSISHKFGPSVVAPGPPIDHAKNRSLNKKNGEEFRWRYVDSHEAIDEIILHLKKCESSVSESDFNDQAMIKQLLVGIDCEWRPQFLMKKQNSTASVVPVVHDRAANDNGVTSDRFTEEQDCLSVYQLAVGDVVYVVDAQIIGAAAAAPLNFIWRPTSRLMLIGFCVSSDIQRIKNTFPELNVLCDRRNTNPSADLFNPPLLELKELALFRHVPAKHWGLSRLYCFCFGEDVDKEEQCSDWGTRPLSTSQLEYAARDAYIVQRLARYLLTDVGFPCSENGYTRKRIMAFLNRFDATCSTNFSHSWTMTSGSQPLGQQHVKAALQALGIQTRFLKCDALGNEGLLVKSIALFIRRKKEGNGWKRLSYAVVVLPLNRSIDMQAFGKLLGVDPDDISLADQETLVRVFGYSRGCLGPVGLREQQAVRIILDSSLQSEEKLLCGAGVSDEVYAVAPAILIAATDASVAGITREC